MFKFGWGQDIGIDLGTATVIAYIKGKGIVLREPSVVAVDNNTGEVVAVGNEARRMLGRTPGNIVATRPLRDGVISDYTVTEKMLKYFIKKVGGKSIFAPRIMICIPSRVTEVEKKAVIDAATQARSKKSVFNRRANSCCNWCRDRYIKTMWKYGSRYWWRNNRYCSYITWRFCCKYIYKSCWR